MSAKQSKKKKIPLRFPCLLFSTLLHQHGLTQALIHSHCCGVMACLWRQTSIPPRQTCISRRPPLNSKGREMVASGCWGELAALGKAKSYPTHPPRHQSTALSQLLWLSRLLWHSAWWGKQSSPPSILNQVMNSAWARPPGPPWIDSKKETEDGVGIGVTFSK